MVNIQLDDQYSITSDIYQFILQEKKVRLSGKNKGEIYYEGVTYHNRVCDCLRSYKQRQMRVCNATSIEELIEVTEKLDKQIELLTKGI